MSDNIYLATAQVIKSVASDGVIAPACNPEALSILRGKRDGRFLALTIDPDYKPEGVEIRDEYGLTLFRNVTRRTPRCSRRRRL